MNRTGGYYPEYGYITDEFVTVGYFVKLKQLYENKNMIWFLGDKDYDNREYPKTVEDDENTIMDRITSRIYTKKDAGVNFKCIGIKLSADNEIVAILKSEKDTIAVKCPKDLNDREYIIRYLCGIDYYNNGFTSYITPKLKHACLEKFILEDDVKMLENDKKYLMFKNGQLVRKELDYENERLKECVKLYGEKKGKLIANYTITLGMTKAMCESAGFKLQSTVITKEGKVQIYNSRSETAVLVNGIVTKIHK